MRGKTILALIALLVCTAAIPSPAQTLTTLVNFTGTNGASPASTIIQGTDGNFYGTTIAGGSSNNCQNGCGTVFKMAPSGTLTTLYSVTQANASIAGIVQGRDGNFSGATYGGGSYLGDCISLGCGTVVKITPSGTVTTLYLFCSQLGCTDGANPYGTPVQAADGNFYGVTADGGASGNCPPYPPYGCGTVFKLTPSGTLTTLYNFCSQPQCADGYQPNSLIQGADGNFYGTTQQGGAVCDCGTVFKITPTGTLTTLHSFNGAGNSSNPNAVTQGTDGNLYGTTLNYGTVFTITTSGSFFTLYSFVNGPPGTGIMPFGLVQGSDGNFYGTTGGGGNNHNCQGGCGTIFEITPLGALTTLYTFDGNDGSAPHGELVQGADGNFYGTTSGGGSAGDGTVFSLSAGPVQSPAHFVPVTPCRLADTRQTRSPIQGGTWQDFVVPQLGGCNIPSTASAYSLNVTVVPHQRLGYLTIWPAGRNQPLVSTMNSPDGRVKANAAIVPAGASSAVSVFATDTTDVILDIDGYFAPQGSGTYQFYTLTPCRVLDTRGSDGSLGGPYLQANQQRVFPVLQSPCFQGVQNPQAYSFNVTVVPHPSGQPLSYLTVWPDGQQQPVVSTLNNPTATAVANAAIVPSGTSGSIEVYARNSTDLIVDVNGYFAAPGQNGLSLYPVVPCRVLDTRSRGNGQPFSGTLNPPVDVVGSACAPSITAQAYVFNATVVPTGSLGYLTLWPQGEQMPGVSTLNAQDGFITSNMAIVPTTNGYIDAYAHGLTQLILDISGYFAP